MEKYLADRLYALIYRMCQVQAFSSRLRARGFPAIGKYGPKTPPRTAGVTKYVIGFGRCSGFVRHFCREGPILRNPETGRASFPRSRTPQSRIGLADAPVSLPRPHFRFCRPERGTSPDGYNARGIRLSSSLSFFGACRNCNSPELSVRPDRKPSAADRSDVGSARNAGSCPAGRAAGLHPSRRLVDRRRRHPIPLGRIRQSYVSLCGGHTRPGVAISPNRGLRLTDRVSDRFRPRGLRRRKKARARKPEASETHKPAGHIV